MIDEVAGNEVVGDQRGHVGILTLNRPHVRNAMNTALRHRFWKLVAEFRDSDDIRVVLITGAGTRAFSAGGDLKERDSLSEEQFLAQRARSCSKALVHYPKPVIAAVNGDALGGGLELALFCDFRIASEDARFGCPEIKRGIFPGSGATSLLARLVGITRAKELIFTGKLVSAAEALEMGLVGEVVPASDLMERSMSLAEEIACNAPIALRQAKMVIEESIALPTNLALRLEDEAWTRCLYSEDRKEGIRAFNEKRPPRFTGR